LASRLDELECVNSDEDDFTAREELDVIEEESAVTAELELSISTSTIVEWSVQATTRSKVVRVANPSV